MLRSSVLVRSLGAFLFAAAVSSLVPPAAAQGEPHDLKVAPADFRKIPSESGPNDYYEIVSTGPEPFIHAAYTPPFQTTVLGYSLPESQRHSVATLSWKWRAVTLPEGGNECVEGKGDSAAVVYVTWRQALRWYSVKYVWSAVAPKGKTCDRKRNPFRAQDTVIVDSGGPLGEWRTVHIDPDREYRNHFEAGDATASVPELLGVAIMTDGDQTNSASAADYAGFVVTLR
jgi:hypothetical protein